MNATASACELAAQRNGVITRAELRAVGLTDRQITGLGTRGSLVVTHRGIYRFASTNESLTTRCTAAWLAAGPDAAVDRASAAILHGLRDAHGPNGEDRVFEPVSVAVPAHRRVVVRGVDVAYRSSLPATDTQRMDGFRVTTPTRTLIDCAALVSARELGFMVDEALRRRITALPILRQRVVDLGRSGRAGAGTMAEVLAERNGEVRGSNTFERDIRRVLTKAGLPLPEMQHLVILPDGSERFLDLAYPAHRLGIEGVSWTWHAQRRDWVADQSRNNGLAAVGWRMIGVTWEQRRRHPESIVTAISEAIGFTRHSRAVG